MTCNLLKFSISLLISIFLFCKLNFAERPVNTPENVDKIVIAIIGTPVKLVKEATTADVVIDNITDVKYSIFINFLLRFSLFILVLDSVNFLPKKVLIFLKFDFRQSFNYILYNLFRS